MNAAAPVRARRAWLAIAGWALLLVAAGIGLASVLKVDADLRLFLPEGETPAERILLEELEEGPGTRLLLVALEGLPADELAAASDQLATTLRASPQFVRVLNGTLVPDPGLQALLLQYRYLLSPRPGGCACDVDSLRQELALRLTELGSPAGALAQELLLRDPTGELQAVLQGWMPARQPALRDGVWFSPDGARALLLAQTTAPGFDADRQRAALAGLQAAAREADASGNLQLTVTGPGAFTVLLEQAVRHDVTLLGSLAGCGSLLFLIFVLRSLRHATLGFLTLATTVIAALAGVALAFPSVHGVTLAFGFTLLGVAMDYPVHYTLHLQRGSSTATTLRSVWPTLRLSIVTTCLAYLALASGGFTGLTQLGVFAVCGLVAAGLVLRFVLPRLVRSEEAREPPPWIGRVERLPAWRSLAAFVIVAAGTALWVSPRPLWSNELAGLTPVPAPLQALDASLRQQLGAPDLRYLIAIRAANAEAALVRDEALREGLDSFVQTGVIGGYQSPSRLLPSVRRQSAVQQQLPTADALQGALTTALADLPFREEVFADFINDVQAARALPPLLPADLADSALADPLAGLLTAREGEALAFVTLSAVRDIDALRAWTAEQGEDVLLLDLTTTAGQLVARYRQQALVALAGALVLIAGLMVLQLGTRVAIAVVAPVLAALAATVAVLNAAGVALTLFHVVSLLLVAGLSFDYGLFFNRTEASAARARTRHSVLVCWISTAAAFALLTLSAMPVLQAIGATVALGVTLGMLFALLGRDRDRAATALVGTP